MRRAKLFIFTGVAWISWSALRHCGGGHTKNTLALKVGKVSSRKHTLRGFCPPPIGRSSSIDLHLILTG